MNVPLPVTTALVQVLAVQVELELGDVYQDIEEMADLCDELLNPDISIQFLIDPIKVFASAIHLHLKGPAERTNLSEKVTDCLRKAVVRLPDFHDVSIMLAQSLYVRFDVAPSNEDYKEGMAILDSILTFRGPGDVPSPCRVGALGLAAMFANARLKAYRKPEHLEHAIYRTRTLIDGTSIKDPYHAVITGHLSSLEGFRLDDTANTRDASVAPLESGKLPSFRELIASFPGPMAAEPDPVTFYELATVKALLTHIGNSG